MPDIYSSANAPQKNDDQLRSETPNMAPAVVSTPVSNPETLQIPNLNPDLTAEGNSTLEPTLDTGVAYNKKTRRRSMPHSSNYHSSPTSIDIRTPEFDATHAPTTSLTRKHRWVDDYSSVMRAEKPTANPFRSFLPKPLRTRFSTQTGEETIILMLRQHVITQLLWIIMVVVALFLPMLFSFTDFFSFLPTSYRVGVYIGWYLILTGFAFESFLKWFYNIYIVTDERIVDIDFVSLIYRRISSAKIDNIEDTTAASSGVLASLFDYGKVIIQTAAEKREFEFSGIPHPTKVTTLINELILEEEREKVEGRVT